MGTDWGRKTTTAVVAAVGLVVGLSAWAIADDPDEGVITACVAPGGEIRIIDPDADLASARSCRPNEREIEWNQQGEPGEAGPAGPAGPAGRTVCAADELLLCLPDQPGLRPQLDGPDLPRALEGEAYRVELRHDVEEVREGGDPTQGRFLVGGSDQRMVFVTGLDDADVLLDWFTLTGTGSPQSFRDVRLRLYDGADVVFTGFLVHAFPRSVTIDGRRVQAVLQVEELIRTP